MIKAESREKAGEAMKMLSEGDGRVVKLIQKNRLRLETFRMSCYVHPFESDGAVVLKHLLTKEALLLSPEEWAALSAGDPPEPMRIELARRRFLVEEGCDEYAEYLLVLSTLRALERKNPGLKSCTIMPTTGCNARCVYCFEEGWPTKTMTPQTADAVVDFLCRRKRKGKLRIDWFGGEPLCVPGILSRICRGLTERGVEFYSTIITNASLFTPALIREALDVWHLSRAQVSMDGAREDYEMRKRYVRPEAYGYETVMENVRRLAEAGISVMIRCNIDEKNVSGLETFYRDAASRFSDLKNVAVYSSLLNECVGGDPERSAALYRAAYAAERALGGALLPPARVERLRTVCCKAAAGSGAVCIDTEGGLHSCDHTLNETPFATVFDEDPVWPEVREEIAPECRTCRYLPDCTPFRRNGCPVDDRACIAQMSLFTERQLQALLAQGGKPGQSAPDASGPERRTP